MAPTARRTRFAATVSTPAAPLAKTRRFLVDLPDGGLRTVAGVRGAEPADQIQPVGVVRSQDVQAPGPVGRHRLDGAVDLASRLGLLIENDRRETQVHGRRRRREAGRPGTDDGEVDTLAHGSTALAPSWRRIRMPSLTGTMQACRLGTPSISIRHSKQTPIMQ